MIIFERYFPNLAFLNFEPDGAYLICSRSYSEDSVFFKERVVIIANRFETEFARFEIEPKFYRTNINICVSRKTGTHKCHLSNTN